MGDQFSWIGSSGGEWNTASNWFDNTTGEAGTRAPTMGDTAIFGSGAYTVTGGGAASEIDLTDGAQITFAGSGTEIYSAAQLDLATRVGLFVDESVLLVNSTSIGANSVLDLTNAPPSAELARVPGSAMLGDVKLAGPLPAGAPDPTGGHLVLGDHTVVVNDVENGNSGIGNDFDARAGIIGTGTLLQAPYSDHPMVQILQDGQPITSLDFGTVHTGDTATLHFTLENFAGNSGGPPAQGALETLVNGGNITDPALSGSGVTPQNFEIGGRGGSEDFTVTLDTSEAHSLDGQAVHIAFQFNNGQFDTGVTLPITGEVVGATEAPIDWDARAAAVEAAFAATGTWYDPTTPGPIPPGPVDWNALAAQVEANFAATGHWYL